MKDTTIAVGLAKNVFEIAISREAGKVKQALSRRRVLRVRIVPSAQMRSDGCATGAGIIDCCGHRENTV